MFVYILTNNIGMLYTGVTNNLSSRLIQHRTKLHEGFTNEKRCFRLVYFELHVSPGEAIKREKQIKGWCREKKEFLIRTLNPPWMDLGPSLLELGDAGPCCGAENGPSAPLRFAQDDA